jgi:hypothetical protein
MIPNKKTARLAGSLWLLMIVFGLFAQVGVRDTIIVLGDAVATTNNIAAHAFLFRLGFVSDLAMMICYLLTPLAFFKLLSAVNKNLSILTVIFGLMGTAIGMLNLLNEFAALHVLSGIEYLNAFDTRQLQAQAMLFLDLYEHGYIIADIFFALWVFPLGILVYKSGFLPRIFGILFVAETITSLLSVVIHFLYPNRVLETNLLLLGAIAEFSFTFWLLIRGINESKVNAAKLSLNLP